MCAHDSLMLCVLSCIYIYVCSCVCVCMCVCVCARSHMCVFLQVCSLMCVCALIFALSLCALECVLSRVCSHMVSLIHVLSYDCSPMCAPICVLSCLLSFVCSHVCVCVLSCACSDMHALMCELPCIFVRSERCVFFFLNVFSHSYSRVFSYDVWSLLPVLSYVCSHFSHVFLYALICVLRAAHLCPCSHGCALLALSYVCPQVNCSHKCALECGSWSFLSG